MAMTEVRSSDAGETGSVGRANRVSYVRARQVPPRTQ
jgi:hypothetical protein